MQQYDINKIVSLLVKRIWLIFLSAIVFAVGSLVVSKYLIRAKYSADILVSVYNSEGIQSAQDLSTAQRLVDSYIIVLKSNSVLEEVAASVELGYSASDIRSMLKASQVENTEIFSVTVTSENPTHSAIIANAIADVAPREITRTVKAGAVEIIDRAKIPTSPSSPNLILNTIIGAILGIVLCAGAIIAFNIFDTTIKDESVLMERYNLPLIGVIPQLEETSKKGQSYYAR